MRNYDFETYLRQREQRQDEIFGGLWNRAKGAWDSLQQRALGNVTGSAAQAAYQGGSDAVEGGKQVFGGVSSMMTMNPMGAIDAISGAVKAFSGVFKLVRAGKMIVNIRKRYQELKAQLEGSPQQQRILDNIFNFDLKMMEYSSPAVLDEALTQFSQVLDGGDIDRMAHHPFAMILATVIKEKADQATSLAAGKKGELLGDMGYNLGMTLGQLGSQYARSVRDRDAYGRSRSGNRSPEEIKKDYESEFFNHFPVGTTVVGVRAKGRYDGDFGADEMVMGKVSSIQVYDNGLQVLLSHGRGNLIAVEPTTVRLAAKVSPEQRRQAEINTQRYSR